MSTPNESENHIMNRLRGNDRRRLFLFGNAPKPLQEKILKIEEWFAREFKRSIKVRYELGQEIKEVYDDANGQHGSRYGANAVNIICGYFDWEESTVYNALRLAQTYTPEEIERYSSMAASNGALVCYSQLLYLTGVPDSQKREQLLECCLKENWSTKRLADSAKAAAIACGVNVAEPGRREPSEERRGRPLAVPKDLDSVLHQQRTSAADFLDRTEVWQRPEVSLTSYARKLGATEITEEKAQKLKTHYVMLQELADEAQKRADEAKKVYEHFMTVVANKERAQAPTPVPQVGYTLPKVITRPPRKNPPDAEKNNL